MSQSIQFGVPAELLGESSANQDANASRSRPSKAMRIARTMIVTAAITAPAAVGLTMLADAVVDRGIRAAMDAKMAEFAKPLPGFDEYVARMRAQDAAEEAAEAQQPAASTVESPRL